MTCMSAKKNRCDIVRHVYGNLQTCAESCKARIDDQGMPTRGEVFGSSAIQLIQSRWSCLACCPTHSTTTAINGKNRCLPQVHCSSRLVLLRIDCTQKRRLPQSGQPLARVSSTWSLASWPPGRPFEGSCCSCGA